MRTLGLNWTFPVYSAYDDSAYSNHMLELDEIRIKVLKYIIGRTFCNPTLCRRATNILVRTSANLMGACLKGMIWCMLLMDYGN